MRTRGVILWVGAFAVACCVTLLFAAPLSGARPAHRGADIPVCRWAQPNLTPEITGSIAPDTAGSPTHADAPRQAGRRTSERAVSKQADAENASAARTRFATITVTIDPGGVPLAAYQFEVTAGHTFTVVGLDNAGHPVFSDPPRYDRAAAADGTDTLIVADYSTRPAGELVAKPQAAATIHAAFHVGDDTDLDALADSITVTLTAAADADGNRIDADITHDLHLAERPGQE